MTEGSKHHGNQDVVCHLLRCCISSVDVAKHFKELEGVDRVDVSCSKVGNVRVLPHSVIDLSDENQECSNHEEKYATQEELPVCIHGTHPELALSECLTDRNGCTGPEVELN